MNSKIRLYFPNDLSAGKVLKLGKKQSHYIKNVLRILAGDKISLFNSINGEWEAKIVSHGKDNSELYVEKQARAEESRKNLWLAFSIIKKIPQDMMLQKTTELGVEKFFPILCERTVVRELNIERSKKILIEASEQSNRIIVPEIFQLKKLKDFIKTFPENGKIIFCDINSNLKSLKNIEQKNPVCILIGPEGDFSENERQSLVDNKKVLSISLGRNVLRAETAAIAATSILSYQLSFTGMK